RRPSGRPHPGRAIACRQTCERRPQDSSLASSRGGGAAALSPVLALPGGFKPPPLSPGVGSARRRRRRLPATLPIAGHGTGPSFAASPSYVDRQAPLVLSPALAAASNMDPLWLQPGGEVEGRLPLQLGWTVYV